MLTVPFINVLCATAAHVISEINLLKIAFCVLQLLKIQNFALMDRYPQKVVLANCGNTASRTQLLVLKSHMVTISSIMSKFRYWRKGFKTILVHSLIAEFYCLEL